MTEISEKTPLLARNEVQGLMDWFGRHGIDYPWGDNPTPYRVWISEIMLQQTVVTAAIDHFIRWMDLFPDIQSLTEAREQAVLKAWEGLGYYSRARNILKGALFLTEHHQGALPSSYEELIKVPGIGDYTARAILSLAFSKSYPVLDANVRRIGQRLRAVMDWQVPDDRLLLGQLEDLIPPESPGAFNCALMQLGQLICRVRSPECASCPLAGSCRTRQQGLQAEIPAPKKRKIREKKSTLLLLTRDGRFLMTRRSRGLGKGLWFIPSVPRGEEGIILRTLKEQTEQTLPLQERVHLYTTWKEQLFPLMLVLRGFPDDLPEWIRSHEDDAVEWICAGDLDSYPTASVYRKILEEIPPVFTASTALEACKSLP